MTEIVDSIEDVTDFPGLTVFDEGGFGREKTTPHEHTRTEDLRDFMTYSALLAAARRERVDTIIERTGATGRSGVAGDGNIFVLHLAEAVRIATGESGEVALQ